MTLGEKANRENLFYEESLKEKERHLQFGGEQQNLGVQSIGPAWTGQKPRGTLHSNTAVGRRMDHLEEDKG